MKLKLIMLVGLFAFGFASMANAGAVTDTDSDLVPDQFDNCRTLANGPNNGTNNQIDTDIDGFGNRCDADFNNTLGSVDLTDFNIFLGQFGNPATGVTDMNADGQTNLTDFNLFVAAFGGPVGPSGLACAGTVPCTP